MKKRKYALSSADFAPPNAPILLQGSIAQNLEKAAGLGYQGLEVHTRECAPLNYDKINNTAKHCGVQISAIVTGRLATQGKVNLIDDRPYITDAAIKGMLAYVDMAAKLNTNLVVGWVKGQLPNNAEKEIYLQRLAQNLLVIAKRAQQFGVKLFIEVINHYEVNIFTTAREIVSFLDNYDIPNCYVHLDTFHMNIEETNPIEAIRTAGSRLGYFHVADNSRCHPGSGTLNFSAVLAALDEIGYNGFISVECFPVPDPITAAKKAIEHLRFCETVLV